MKIHHRKPALATLVLTSLLIVSCAAAGRKGSMEKPDFTKGDPIPEGANHDWTLGATGARGWIDSIYQKLSYEEIKPLLPAIHEAIVTPAPSGIISRVRSISEKLEKSTGSGELRFIN